VCRVQRVYAIAVSLVRASSRLRPTPWTVDVRQPGKGDSNSHGARPVHQIISIIKRIRTRRLSIKISLSLSEHSSYVTRSVLQIIVHLAATGTTGERPWRFWMVWHFGRIWRIHMQTLITYKRGFNQNYYTFTSIMLTKIVMCSKFHRTKFINYKCFHMRTSAVSSPRQCAARAREFIDYKASMITD